MATSMQLHQDTSPTQAHPLVVLAVDTPARPPLRRMNERGRSRQFPVQGISPFPVYPELQVPVALPGRTAEKGFQESQQKQKLKPIHSTKDAEDAS